MRKGLKTSTVIQIVVMVAMSVVSWRAKAEERFLESLPTTGKTTVKKLIASKAIGFQCASAVRSDDSGNLVGNKRNKKKTWYDAKGFPENSDKAESSNKAYKCLSKSFQDGKMKNADLDETAE